MKISVELKFLSQFLTPMAACDLDNELSYRHNIRIVHRYEKYGLLNLYDFVRSKGRGAPKIRYELTSFGKSFLEHFEKRELQDSNEKET